MALAGDTLFFTTMPENGPASTLYQLDHLLSPDAKAQPIAILPASAFGNLVSADARIVFFAGAAWDRAQRRFVTNESNTGGGGVGMWLTGHSLAVAAPADTRGHPYVEQVTIYGTTRLPART